MNKLTYLLLFVLTFSFINTANSNTSQSTSNAIQRVRIDFITPLNYTKHLLLGFTPNNAATDGVDYGYDALTFENLDDDLNWVIENENYVIQGVGQFDSTKQFPLNLFLSNSGEFQIVLNALENFDNNINVYIYDAQIDTFTSITESNYVNNLHSGDYQDRFYLTFSNDSTQNNTERNNTLSLNDSEILAPTIQYLGATKEISIKTNNSASITALKLYNLNGQEILSTNNINSSNYKLTFANITSNYVVVNVYANNHKMTNKLLLIH